MTADLIIKNGKLYEKNVPWKNTAVAVIDGKIAAIGSDEIVEQYTGENTKVIDAGGKSVLPGFIDAHLHATMCTELYITKLIYDMDRGENESREDYIERIFAPVKEYAEENPDMPVVRATGWNPAAFNLDKDGVPTRHDVDKICSDRPVTLRSYDHHSILVNTKALEMGGIDANTPDPRNGVMPRDENGMPTGFFEELSAECLLLDALDVADFSVEEYKEGIRKFQEEHAFPNGLVGIFDAYATDNAIEAYRQMAKDGELKIRVSTAILADLMKPMAQFHEMVADKGKFDVGDSFKIETVKFFCDGGGFTFYMNEPLEADVLKQAGYPEDYRGFPQWTEEEMKEAFLILAKGGYQIHVHCMGDGAVKQTLNAFEYVEQCGVKGRRNSIAHVMNIDDGDIERMARLGVVASIQPSWPIIDYFAEYMMIPMVGRKRTYEMYPIGRLKKAGAVIASGTDFPVAPDLNPFFGLQVGMTRTSPKESPYYEQYKGIIAGPEDNPEVELLTLEEAIESYSWGGAYQMFLEDVTGSLEVGKSADITILDSDITAVDPMDIGKVKVEKLIFQGEEINE